MNKESEKKLNTNRKWQNHLKSKGIIPFFLDRLKSHALSSAWQHEKGPFYFPIEDRETDDELSKAFFEMVEDFPYEYYLELSSYCNLKCKMCARSQMTRKDGIMSNDLFKKIIDEIYESQPYAYIHMYGIGESMMDTNLYQKLDYAYSKGLTNTVLFTNGQLLLENDNYIKLANSGLASIGVDLDGFSKEVYEQIRVGGDFEIVKKGIEKLSEYIKDNKLRSRLEIAYQIYPGVNEKDIDAFVEWCTANNLEYKMVTMHTWAGLRDDIPATNVDKVIEQHHGKRETACCYLWDSFFVGWDGRVGLCFQDADIRECMGNLNKSSIREVWHGKCAEKKKEHIKLNFSGICSGCNTGTGVYLPKKSSKLYPNSLRGEE